MDLKETKDVLNNFAKYVIQQSRSTLTKNKKNVSNKLYKSIDYNLDFNFDGSGFISQKSKGGKRGLKGMPNIGALDRWSVRKSQLKKKVRDSKGRFIPRKSLVFLIARKIFLRGIKPSLFFTKPFEKRFKTLPPELIASFVNDFEKEI